MKKESAKNFEKSSEKHLTIIPKRGIIDKLSRERSVNIENFIV